jgi:hypothetical protein
MVNEQRRLDKRYIVMTKLTPQQLAAKIREKHPRKYKALSDSELVELWLNKNPQDADLIKKESEGFGWYLFWYLFFSFSIWFGLTVYNTKISEINFINRINKEIFGKNSKFVNKSFKKNEYTNPIVSINDQSSSGYEEPNYNYAITQDAKDFINNSPIISVLRLDQSTINTLLAILSDPNPDPNNRLGEFCDNTTTRCLYCNKLVPGQIYTYQKYFEIELDCAGLASAYNPRCIIANSLIDKHSENNTESEIITESENNTKSEINKSGTVEEQLNSIDWKKVMGEALVEQVTSFKPIIERACSDFKNGEKYICVEKPITKGSNNFCSEKCKTEYNYSH